MNYNYSMLVEDLLLGREFEFTYKGKIYGIINAHKGYVLCKENEVLTHYYDNVLELLSNIRIKNKSIEEVFNEIDDYYIL